MQPLTQIATWYIRRSVTPVLVCISGGCESYEYECDDGECVFGSSSGCDGVTECGDGSDEDGCGRFC